MQMKDSIATGGKFVLNLNIENLQNSSDVFNAQNILLGLLYAHTRYAVHVAGGEASLAVYNGSNSYLLKLKDSYNTFDPTTWYTAGWVKNHLARDDYGYRNTMVSALKGFMAERVDAISEARYKAIAWFGLQNTEAYKKDVSIGDKADIRVLLPAASAPSIFDKCQ
jgi:hypothetical protein